MTKKNIMVVALCLGLFNIVLGQPIPNSFRVNSTTTVDNNSETQFISIEQLQAKLANKETVVIVDLRGGDYEGSTTKIKSAIRIPPSDLEKHLKDLPKDKMIVTYCSCPTDGGAIAGAQTLMKNGFKQVYVLKGGWNGWNNANGLVEPK